MGDCFDMYIHLSHCMIRFEVTYYCKKFLGVEHIYIKLEEGASNREETTKPVYTI